MQSIGLIEIHYKLGDNKGAQYEVFLPEESSLDWSLSPPLPPPTTTAHNLVGGTTQELVEGGEGERYINIDKKVFSKTIFKDNNTNDDEAFAHFIEKFQVVSKELTGKNLAKRDGESLGKLADILILELKTAARRTDAISSVPAFLTEVLRRKLLGGSSSAATATGKASKMKLDTVGTPNEAGEYEKKPLDAAGRESALHELRDFAGEEFLKDFERWYTAEDWRWLTAELDKGK